MSGFLSVSRIYLLFEKVDLLKISSNSGFSWQSEFNSRGEFSNSGGRKSSISLLSSDDFDDIYCPREQTDGFLRRGLTWVSSFLRFSRRWKSETEDRPKLCWLEEVIRFNGFAGAVLFLLWIGVGVLFISDLPDLFSQCSTTIYGSETISSSEWTGLGEESSNSISSSPKLPGWCRPCITHSAARSKKVEFISKLGALFVFDERYTAPRFFWNGFASSSGAAGWPFLSMAS